MKTFLNARQQFIRENPLHLEWDTWHEHKYYALLFQPHAGCGTISIRNVYARFWQHSLAAVALTHLKATTLKEREHIIVCSLTKLQLGIKKLANCRFRDIIGSGTQTTRHQNQFSIHTGIKCIKDGSFGITDG